MLVRCLVSALVMCEAAVAWNSSPPAAELWKQHMDLGRALEASGHYVEAKEQFQAALRISASFPKDGMNFATRAQLGSVTALMGQYTEAEQWDNEAVRLGLEIYGKESPELAIPFTNLAALYRDQGEYARAEELGRRALRLTSDQETAAPAALAHVLGTLGGILYYRGKLPEAEAILLQTIQIAKKLPLSSEILPGALTNLAGVYAKAGRKSDALATFQEAYTLCSKAGGSNNPSLFFVLAGMAAVQADSGHYAEAVASIQSGIQLAQVGGAVNTMLVRDALAAEAAWLHKLKREDEAKRIRARAKEVARAAAQNSYSQYTLDARQVAQGIARKPE